MRAVASRAAWVVHVKGAGIFGGGKAGEEQQGNRNNERYHAELCGDELEF